MIQWLSSLFSKDDPGLMTGKPRSPQWRHFRERFLTVNCLCEGCGTGANLEAHHLIPYSQEPDLELEWSNLLAMCRECHFQIGHLRDWGLVNPHAREDAKVYRERFREARKRKPA